MYMTGSNGVSLVLPKTFCCLLGLLSAVCCCFFVFFLVFIVVSLFVRVRMLLLWAFGWYTTFVFIVEGCFFFPPTKGFAIREFLPWLGF